MYDPGLVTLNVPEKLAPLAGFPFVTFVLPEKTAQPLALPLRPPLTVKSKVMVPGRCVGPVIVNTGADAPCAWQPVHTPKLGSASAGVANALSPRPKAKTSRTAMVKVFRILSPPVDWCAPSNVT